MSNEFLKYDEWGIPYSLDKWWIRNTFNKNETYPPYNIGVQDYNIVNEVPRYFIEVAVAGMKSENLQVEVRDEAGVKFLYIKGKNDRVEDNRSEGEGYLHRGIATRQFKLVFELGKNTEVSNVSLSNGILRVDMQVIIAEEEKPKIFEIKKAD